jgi:hypothetical protein
MNFILLVLFILLTAECITVLFLSSKEKKFGNLLTVVIFLSAIRLSLPLASSSNLDFSKVEPFVEIFRVVLPLVVASLAYSLLKALISRSLSKKSAQVVSIFRPIWMVGFAVLSINSLSTITNEIVSKSLVP